MSIIASRQKPPSSASHQSLHTTIGIHILSSWHDLRVLSCASIAGYFAMVAATHQWFLQWWQLQGLANCRKIYTQHRSGTGATRSCEILTNEVLRPRQSLTDYQSLLSYFHEWNSIKCTKLKKKIQSHCKPTQTEKELPLVYVREKLSPYESSYVSNPKPWAPGFSPHKFMKL